VNYIIFPHRISIAIISLKHPSLSVPGVPHARHGNNPVPGVHRCSHSLRELGFASADSPRPALSSLPLLPTKPSRPLLMSL